MNKALYGLKQSPMEWNVLINDFIISLNFTQCIDDKCVYLKKCSNNSIVYIGLYVDDIILAGNNMNDIKSIKSRISNSLVVRIWVKSIHI